jgi:hypothetical protein
MISSGIDPQAIFDITNASPFDIIAPETTSNTSNSGSPYIIISFAVDTNESRLAVQHNSPPNQHIQHESALVVPQFHAVCPQVDDDPSTQLGLEIGTSDVANDFWWTRFNSSPESRSYSWSESPFNGPPYGSQPDNSGAWGTGNASDLLDVYTTALSGSYSDTIEPWQTTLTLTLEDPDSMDVEDWSSEYEWTDNSDSSTDRHLEEIEEESTSECNSSDDDDEDMSDYDPDDE